MTFPAPDSVAGQHPHIGPGIGTLVAISFAVVRAVFAAMDCGVEKAAP